MRFWLDKHTHPYTHTHTHTFSYIVTHKHTRILIVTYVNIFSHTPVHRIFHSHKHLFPHTDKHFHTHTHISDFLSGSSLTSGTAPSVGPVTLQPRDPWTSQACSPLPIHRTSSLGTHLSSKMKYGDLYFYLIQPILAPKYAPRCPTQSFIESPLRTKIFFQTS